MWTALSLAMVLCWAGATAYWMSRGPSNPKMDAVGWIAAGQMLRDEDSPARLYDLRVETFTIEVSRAPGRIWGSPDELTLTRILPGRSLVDGAKKLGYEGTDPPAFVYSPGAAAFGIPLAWFGWPRATVVIDLLGLLALGAVTARIIFRLHGVSLSSLAWVAALLAMYSISHPLRFSLFLGQITPILLAGWVAARRPANRGTETAQGLVVGVLGVMKVFPMILVFWFIVRRRWLAATVALVVFAGGCLAGGVNALEAWMRAAAQMSGGVRVWTDNQSVAAMLHRFIYPLDLIRDWLIIQPASLIAASILIGLAMLSWWLWRAVHSNIRVEGDLRLFAALWLIPAALSSLFWSHYLVLAFPAIALLLADTRDALWVRITAAVAGVLLFLDANTWTAAMPVLTSAIGSNASTFVMRILVGLPSLAIIAVFILLVREGTKSTQPDATRLTASGE